MSEPCRKMPTKKDLYSEFGLSYRFFVAPLSSWHMKVWWTEGFKFPSTLMFTELICGIAYCVFYSVIWFLDWTKLNKIFI